MQTPFLVRFLRTCFRYLQSCTVLLLVGYAVLFFTSAYMPRQYRQSGVASIRLKNDAVPVRITRGGQPAPVTVEKITGDLTITEGVTAEDPFASIARSSIFVSNFIHGLFLCVVFHLLWRLFENLAQREFFSDRNLVYVRRLGLTLVSYAFLTMAVDTWKGWRINGYVADHLTFEGVKAVTLSGHHGGWGEFFSAIATFARFDFSLALTGLGALVLAEVFRQGLALKEESDLTV